MGISMAGLCALFVVALSRPAAACGALESAWWSFQTPVPASGSTAVALDGAFVLRVQPFARVVPARSIAELLTRSFNDPETVEVRLRDSAGALVAGDLRAFGGQHDPAAVFVPRMSLQAGSTYRLTAVVHNDRVLAVRPDGATGETTVEVALTTGTESLLPLASNGVLQARAESYLVPKPECICPCPEYKPHMGYQARLTLPAVTGGFADVDYDVGVVVSRDQPARPVLPNYTFAKLAPGTSKELLVPMPDEQPGAVVCLSVRIEDARGRSLELSAPCLPKLGPLPPPPFSRGTAPASPAAATTAPPPATGCSLAPTSPASPWAWILGLLALGVVAARARRCR
jgi:MYXO-CTERM domain-containing protein